MYLYDKNLRGGILLFKNVSKLQLSLSFFIVLISFLQAYNQWGERIILAIFFLILGILLLVLSIIGVIIYRKRADNYKLN